jgi:hypothetical protein
MMAPAEWRISEEVLGLEGQKRRESLDGGGDRLT